MKNCFYSSSLAMFGFGDKKASVLPSQTLIVSILKYGLVIFYSQHPLALPYRKTQLGQLPNYTTKIKLKSGVSKKYWEVLEVVVKTFC